MKTSIFAEMKHVMNAIQGSLQTVVAVESKRVSINSFMSNEDNFKKFITHVLTNYKSLRKQRIDILMTHRLKYGR